jgi:DNA-binding NarL/FixJ family response regulator
MSQDQRERSAEPPMLGQPGRRLTSRQLEVLRLMADGHSNQAISEMLYISKKAVVQHTSQIYARLDLHANDDDHRRVKAVLRYLGG